MNTIREKWCTQCEDTTISYVENQKESFHKTSSLTSSFRVHENGYVGIFCHEGRIEDAEGYAKAHENLKRLRPYPFQLETGKRERDKTERMISDQELSGLAEDCMEYIREKYPQFTCSMKFNASRNKTTTVNDLGMAYSNIDYAVSANVSFRASGSKDLNDGNYGFSLRNFDEDVFKRMTDLYLGNFEKEVELPGEILFDVQYYGLLGNLISNLNGESLALGTSLLTGKIGEKIFADDLTVYHDLSDEECWFSPFWDGDGCVLDQDRLPFIDKGVILTGYADKRTARKYQIPHTKTAYFSTSDIPGPGGLNLRIKRSEKTVKELLQGRCCVIPLISTGSGFNEKGDQTMVVNSSLLFDGEKVLGRLPEFKVSMNLLDVFGKDFIGVGSDNPITYNDKQLLYRAYLVNA